MYKIKFILMLLVVGACFSSCSVYQYTARQVDVKTRNLDSKQQMAGVKIDFNRKVTATSEYQISKSEAIREAEFKCLKESGIDVIVDPIFEIKYNPWKLKMRFQATVTGFAGMYEEKATGVDATKEYTREEIENFKLLTDPDFPQYFYQKDAGDSYFINSNSSSLIGKESKKETKLALTPDKKMKPQKKLFDYGKAYSLRNAGMITTIAGAVSMFLIGIPCLCAPDREYSYEEPVTESVWVDQSYYDDYYGTWVDDGYWDYQTNYETRYGYEPNSSAKTAGGFFVGMGAAAIAAGIPMWCIGSYRMKHSNNSMDLSLKATGNGLGFNLTF